MNDPIQTDEFKKRRNQKNWIVLGLILGCVALIWGTTLLKLQAVPKPSPMDTSLHETEEQK